MSKQSDLKTLRELLMKYPLEASEFHITAHQMNLYLRVATFHPVGASSRDIAKWCFTSVQNASTQLNKLYQKGYLRRKEVTAPSGGKEFMYFQVSKS